jgi:hypothetical protein
MYISFQNNKIVGYTVEPQDLILYNLDRVEETNDEYIYDRDIGEYVLYDDEYKQKELEKAKQAKYQENETIREQFLVSGVEYKEILWDSDIEQKLNISIQVSSMGDEDVVTWVAMDGVTSLECTKEDLLNIGVLLTQMTAYVWQYKNPQIKMAIAEAQTIEELDEIEIVYDLGEINGVENEQL